MTIIDTVHKTSVAINEVFGVTAVHKPYELCIQCHTPDEDTLLAHDDYFFTRRELELLKKVVDEALSG